MSALFIVNKLSEGVARKGSVLNAIAENENVALHHISDFKTLPDLVANAAFNKISHVFIEGGDGTVQGVLTEFLKQKDCFKNFPLFSIIPGGMTNQVAKNIGLKSAKVDIIKQALRDTSRRKIASLLKITSPDHPPYFGFLFSTGAVPLITNYTKTKLHKHGIGGSMAVFGGILRGMSGKRDGFLYPTDISLNIDDVSITENHLGTLITTLPGLMLGLDPFWGKQNAPLRVTYVDGAIKDLYRQIIGLWLGNKHKDRSKSGMNSWNANCVKYHYDGPVVLDGEPLSFPSGEFEVHATEPVEFVY